MFADSGTTSRAEVRAADSAGFNPKDLLPKFEAYENAKKWVNDTSKKISDTVEAVKNAPSKAREWVAGLFGKTAETQARAQQQAKAVTEGGQSIAERVNELEQELAPQSIEDSIAVLDTMMTGAPKIFSIASSRLKALMRQNALSVDKLEDQVINLETWARNQPLLGTWQGNYDWESSGYVLQGSIALIFKPDSKSANKLTMTLSNDFYYNGKLVGKTRGTAVGTLDQDGIFRGVLNWSNVKTKGSGDVVWTVRGKDISGNIFEDPNPSLLVPFSAQQIYSKK